MDPRSNLTLNPMKMTERTDYDSVHGESAMGVSIVAGLYCSLFVGNKPALNRAWNSVQSWLVYTVLVDIRSLNYLFCSRF